MNKFREKQKLRNQSKLYLNKDSCGCGGVYSPFNENSTKANRFSGAFVTCCDKCGNHKK